MLKKCLVYHGCLSQVNFVRPHPLWDMEYHMEACLEVLYYIVPFHIGRFGWVVFTYYKSKCYARVWG